MAVKKEKYVSRICWELKLSSSTNKKNLALGFENNLIA